MQLKSVIESIMKQFWIPFTFFSFAPVQNGYTVIKVS